MNFPLGPFASDMLLDLSQGFLTSLNLLTEGRGVLVQAHYDEKLYDARLFERLSVDLPLSLVSSVDKRLAEFLAGRTLASVAQAALGLIPGQVTIGSDRAPVWPHGLSGSISHTQRRCACLLLPEGQGTPGIDVEAIAKGCALDAILRQTLNEDERALIAEAPNPIFAATLCFSAKEALFKALYPTVRRQFGFTAARVCALPQIDSLRLHLTETLHPNLTNGRTFDLSYAASESHVLTWMVNAG